MILFYSTASPFARVCRITIREKDGLARVQEKVVTVFENPGELIAANPTGKVPALQTSDGFWLTETALIFPEFDNALAGRALTPPDGPARAAALAKFGLHLGLMDATVRLTQELRRDAALQSAYWTERWNNAISRALEAMNAEITDSADQFEIDEISALCALEYIEFRHPYMTWRSDYPALAAFCERHNERASANATRPHD